MSRIYPAQEQDLSGCTLEQEAPLLFIAHNIAVVRVRSHIRPSET